MTSVGFCVNEADKCVYYRFSGGEGVILCLYVDDILLFGTTMDAINKLSSLALQPQNHQAAAYKSPHPTLNLGKRSLHPFDILGVYTRQLVLKALELWVSEPHESMYQNSLHLPFT